MRTSILAIAAATAASAASSPAAAAPISVRDSFRIGTGGSTFCSAQSNAVDKVLTSMFDSAYAITCRDAALPVGKLYKLRDLASASGRLAAARANEVNCDAARTETLAGLGQVEVIDCKLKDIDVGYRAYQYRQGRNFFAVEGLAGYDTALTLALRSLAADAPVKGDVSIATTGVGDPVAFARVQAGTLDPAKALAEAYRRNNAGSYAESAEFFAAVSSSDEAPLNRTEALVNEALQKSNLGRAEEAEALFARATQQGGGDPIVTRRIRNYRAIHELNLGDPKGAIEELEKAMPTTVSAVAGGSGTGPATSATIDDAMAKRLNAESRVGLQLGAQADELLPVEKAEILDGQALQLRGTALRLLDRDAEASAALRSADQRLQAVRGGKVASIIWMRAQILGDLAAIAERGGNGSEAQRLYREGVALLEINYPGSAALLNAKARLAGYLARTGQLAMAEEMFRAIVQSQSDSSNLPPTFANVLKPYVELLLKRENDPAATAEIFSATQLMVRPGLAQTQAVLARELTGGTDEASRLFRQAVSLNRQVERARIELARFNDLPKPSPEEIVRARAIRATLAQSEREQVATQSALASFPRYRAVAGEVIPLADFQKTLRPGEAYYRMTVVGADVFAIFVTPSTAKAVKLAVTAKQLSEEVDALRETISTVEDGVRQTFPFDVGLSHAIYQQLFAPFAGDLAGVSHLIVEPDGAMLRLPPNLLVMDQASVDSYTKRAAAGDDAAQFDFRGIRWFGRDRDISTAVSPRSFAQLRNAPPSSGAKEYLGLGNNTPPKELVEAAVRASLDRDCVLPLASWSQPIAATELNTAGDIFRRVNPNGVLVLTQDDFTDTSLKQRTDLDDYRIIHFATHGVVTARAAKCAAQPALLTSFGDEDSDGLLTFREIFDLDLDADLVILSACDTAGTASAAATRAAGLASGGDVALDGLVRAFVGAGGRMVIASHWPVPDDFNATQRLIAGLFAPQPGMPTARALRLSQQALMDEADTSHPFYWSAFAIVGDGEAPIVRAPKQAIAEAK